MKRIPYLSIIVPSRTGKIDLLRVQLSQQTFKNWELIVNTEPPTPGHARNQGAREAKGPFLLFFDDDVRLSHEKFLDDLVKSLLLIDNRSALGVPCRIAPDINSFQKRLYQESFTDPEPAQKLSSVSWLDTVNGRCMAIRRDTFWKLGGFDPHLIAGEDPEFLYRVCRNDGKVYMLSTRWVYYYPPADFKTLIKKTRWYARGNSQVTRKFPESNYRPVIRNIFHAVAMLLLHTLIFLPLMFLKVSFHHRKISFSFRPYASLMAYYGFWIYCISWFTVPPVPKNTPALTERVTPHEPLEAGVLHES